MKRWSAVAVTTAVVGVGLGLPNASAAPEPPAPPGLQLIFREGTMTTGDRFTQLSCPRNPVVKVPLGGGARIRTATGDGGDGQLKFTSLAPFDIGASGTFVFIASVASRPAYTQPWALDMWVLCGERPPGYELVLSDNTDGPPDDDPGNNSATGVGAVSTTASCPAGKKLLAVGGQLSTSAAQRGTVALTSMQINTNGRSAIIAGADDTTDGEPLSTLTVYPVRVCATDPAGHQVVLGTPSPLDDSTTKLRRATCSNGRIAYGFGMSKSDQFAHAYVDGVVPDSLNGDGLHRRYSVRAEQRAPLRDWSLQTHVICANPLQ